jgi:hypothetical protein
MSTKSQPRVNNLNMPFSVLVRRVDPDFDKARARELQYDFPSPGRYFYADPNNSGAYGGGFDLGFDRGFRTPLADRS